MNGPPLALWAYRAVVAALGPLAGPWLRARARRGKEDPARLPERFGRASLPRPTGELIWLHGASVGESRVLLTVQAALAAARPGSEFLITTGTRTSATLIADRLPPRTRHQYAPLDRPDAVRRFLAHWRPQLGVFAESELWPNLLFAARRAGVRLALINAAVSPRTLAGWAARPASARALLRRFDAILAADARTQAGVGSVLGEAPPAPGNLKLAAPPPPVDAAARAALAASLGARPVWLAASTHPGEDAVALAAHVEVRARLPGALLILCPRHPERGAEVAALAGGAPRRSQGQALQAAHPVYVADTLGELGLFYACAPVALVGGSLLPPLEGHNPIEPAQLGAAILSGPNVDSFADVYAALDAVGGVVWTADAPALAQAVIALLQDPDARARQTAAARAAVGQGGPALDATVQALLALLPATADA